MEQTDNTVLPVAREQIERALGDPRQLKLLHIGDDDRLVDLMTLQSPGKDKIIQLIRDETLVVMQKLWLKELAEARIQRVGIALDLDTTTINDHDALLSSLEMPIPTRIIPIGDTGYNTRFDQKHELEDFLLKILETDTADLIDDSITFYNGHCGTVPTTKAILTILKAFTKNPYQVFDIMDQVFSISKGVIEETLPREFRTRIEWLIKGSNPGFAAG